MEKKKVNFTIMSDQKKHKTLDLSSISPVIIDIEEKSAYVDMGALHARSKVEKGIKFGSDLNEITNGKEYFIVWVSISSYEKGQYIHGVGAAKMIIDQENRKGYKILADHVNSMDAAMKGKYKLDGMDEAERRMLKEFIIGYKAELWENSPEALHALFST